MLRMLIICIKIYNRCKILQTLQFLIFLRNFLNLPNLYHRINTFFVPVNLATQKIICKTVKL